MVPIGDRPILWHIMKYYAHFGHKDFILCLGYRAEAIKEYFLNYNEALSNDFVLSDGGTRRRAAHAATSTTGRSRSSTPGLHANIGERLQAVEQYLEGDEVFLANYGDGLTDAPLADDDRRRSRRAARSRRFLLRPADATASTSSRCDDGGRRAAIQRHHARPTSGSTAASSSSAARSSTTSSRARSSSSEPFQRLIARGRAARVPVRRLLGADGHVQGQAALEALLRERAQPPWQRRRTRGRRRRRERSSR